MQFECHIEMKKGYVPTMETEAVNEFTFIIEAKNRVTADRILHAMFDSNNNISYSCIAISK